MNTHTQKVLVEEYLKKIFRVFPEVGLYQLNRVEQLLNEFCEEIEQQAKNEFQN
jgi:hypothetical protein